MSLPQTFQEIYHKLQENTNQDSEQQPKNKTVITSALGCVIDYSRPVCHSGANKGDEQYTMEIKLVDDSYQNIPSSTQSVSVFLFSNKQKELSQIVLEIGDILYLDRFTFKFWNKVKLQAKYQQSYDNLYQVEIEAANQGVRSTSLYRIIGKSRTKEKNPFLTERVLELSEWLKKNFVTQVFTPFLGIVFIENYGIIAEPFSMVLKVTKVVRSMAQTTLYLTDKNQNLYTVDLSEFPLTKFDVGLHVFVRGIKYIASNYELILSASGNLIRIPEICSEKCHQISNYQAVHSKKLKNYHKNMSLISSKSLTRLNINPSKPVSISQLNKISQNYRLTMRKDELILPNFFIVEACAVTFKGQLQLYHEELNMIIEKEMVSEFPVEDLKNIIDNRVFYYIYSGTVTLVDETVQNKKQLLKVYISTIDEDTSFFEFSLIEKLNKTIQTAEESRVYQEVSLQIEEKLTKFVENSSLNRMSLMALEPIKSEVLSFRLIHTKI